MTRRRPPTGPITEIPDWLEPELLELQDLERYLAATQRRRIE